MNQSKLLLLPCSQEETEQLAKDILGKLKRDYGLEDQVEILSPKKRNKVRENSKDHRHPLVSDFFADVEAQIDIGRNPLKDIVRGKHIVLLEHLLTPNRSISESWEQKVSVNDHHMRIRGFLDVLGKVETLQITLAIPYLAYVRSHSIEKYEAEGFFQFNSLRLVLKDYVGGGAKVLIAIDPHSEKAAQEANSLGLDFRSINPFQSGRDINPYKLGLSGDKAIEIIQKLRPFQERFTRMKEQNPDHLYGVSVDSGTERRTENFIERAYSELSPEKLYARLAYFSKRRFSYEDIHSSFKQFSQINGENIDREGTYVIIDDMFASSETAAKVAKMLKNCGAKRVEVWTSHAVTMPSQYSKANARESIDQVVCLDTVPQHPLLNVEYIYSSADFLAAELYKAHQKLVAAR